MPVPVPPRRPPAPEPEPVTETLDVDPFDGREPDADAPRTGGRRSGRAIAMLVGYGALALVSLLVLGITGYAWGTLQTATTGILRSDALANGGVQKSLNGDTNILIMGLDSRLDENGNPLPQDIYNALHAGDDSAGGYNSNVLMLLHVPVNGKAIEISIPRDDYVDLPGAPDGVKKEKIKQAYGLAFDQKYKQLRNQGVTDKVQLEQQSRDAGRAEEAQTVSQFLGGVAIDHFVEVTLVAFYQIAGVVQPITVCLTDPTQDTYSGAKFAAGRQELSAQQAVAFVRQRRDNVKGDPNYNNFTDLDRERRQQAFIASLAYQLKQAGTFTDPGKISNILNIAKQNTAIDAGLNLLDFAQEASNLTGGNIQFNTLPVASFADVKGAGAVNIVDVPQIQALVRQLLGTQAPTPAAPASGAPSGAPGATPAATGTVDVVNTTSQQGEAGAVERGLGGKGFTQGNATTEHTAVRHTIVEYGSSGTQAAANSVATLLGGVPVQRSTAVPSGRVRVVIGSDFTMPAALSGAAAPSAAATPAPAASSAAVPPPSAGSGSATAPNPLAGGGIPCVK